MTRRPPQGDRVPLSPGYAIPPPLFPPAPWPHLPEAPAPVAAPRHRRSRTYDGAFVSGVLTLFSLASLLVAIAVVAV
ncbi:hypothetical protein HZZ00_35490 [Streptomyces sp. NEAU-sy36]|uniref:hypothetical protein n=1 Tax=unclassified Streptomyces TaxID=2593676 RepID=UPI0015D62C55|nr:MULTISPECIES: hypothetical protein [unclassified Streptomyces]QLJ05805.1 hypothetical protein HZZ00_35490 [Streptomyces sp. NEAU-sy36]